jgi:hypothetical protein
MKTTTCNKCGKPDLTWRMSAKGKWYLSDPRIISTNTHGNYITIPFAHKCRKAEPQEAPKSQEYLVFRLGQLIEKQTLHPEWMTESDLDELERINLQLDERKAN